MTSAWYHDAIKQMTTVTSIDQLNSKSFVILSHYILKQTLNKELLHQPAIVSAVLHSRSVIKTLYDCYLLWLRRGENQATNFKTRDRSLFKTEYGTWTKAPTLISSILVVAIVDGRLDGKIFNCNILLRIICDSMIQEGYAE